MLLQPPSKNLKPVDGRKAVEIGAMGIRPEGIKTEEVEVVNLRNLSVLVLEDKLEVFGTLLNIKVRDSKDTSGDILLPILQVLSARTVKVYHARDPKDPVRAVTLQKLMKDILLNIEIAEDFSGSPLLRISDPPQALMVQLPQELVQGSEMLRRDLFVGAQYGLITIRLPGMLIDRGTKANSFLELAVIEHNKESYLFSIPFKRLRELLIRQI